MSNNFIIGNFDGVHKGHQYLIQEALKLTDNHLKAITFKPHPSIYFNNNLRLLLTEYEVKKELLLTYGVIDIIEMDFTKLWKLSPEEFIKKIYNEFVINAIITGSGFKFGHKASGNAYLLKEIADKYKIQYITVPEAKTNGNQKYSSTIIRTLIANGEIEQANLDLGHNFKIRNQVIYGRQLARQLGFPTINMLLPANMVNIKYGVYASIVNINGIRHNSISNFGIRPTVHEGMTEVLETHILNYDGNLYDRILEVELLKFIRAEEKFNNLTDLKNAIKSDIDKIKLYFDRVEI